MVEYTVSAEPVILRIMCSANAFTDPALVVDVMHT